MRHTTSLVLLFIIAYLRLHGLPQNDVISGINKLIFNGEFDSATIQIESLITDSIISESTAIDLFTLRGEIEKLRGNMDRALFFWKKSNILRQKLYPPGDFRLTWNYALLSNYHYEKVNWGFAKTYADSCAALLEGLSTTQQKEIEIHRIWNILAQSYKLHTPQGNFDFAPWDSVYTRVRNLYNRSLAFQEKHNTGKHYLAKTYHLLGNAYHDLVTRGLRTPGYESQGIVYLDKANENYQLALALWQELYGPVHYQKALTHFVQGLMYEVVPLEQFTDKFAQTEKHLKRALRSFGITDEHPSTTSLLKVPNKSDLLMCLKIFTDLYINMPQHHRPEYYLEKMTTLNNIALELWEIMHAEFQSSTTNQQLAIYYLVPFKQTYFIQLELMRRGESYSIERMFACSQRLKYFDLLQTGAGATNEIVMIDEIQNRLDRGDRFIDYFTYFPYLASAIVITNDTAYVTLLDSGFDFRRRAIDLRDAIVNFDMPSYTVLARRWYQTVLEPLNIQSTEKLIICSHGHLHDLPFEALLLSHNDQQTPDYRNLDYLIGHHEVHYVSSPTEHISKADTLPLAISVIAPRIGDTSSFSDLPFSRMLAADIIREGYGWSNVDKNIPLDSLFNTDASILHVNTHGVIDTFWSEYSQLVLGESRLNLQEVYAKPCRANLVVLNACNSSRGILYEDDGIHGFVRAYFAAGAEAVMSNLWEVDDRSSNALLKLFYDRLSDGQPSAEALRNARVEVLEQAATSDQAARYYWAGPKLVGNEMVFRTIGDDDQNYRWKRAVAGVVLLLAIYGSWIWRKWIKKPS